VHTGDLARGCSDLEMTWLLCCAGAATVSIAVLLRYLCVNYSVFDADTLCHAVTLIFDPLTLKVHGTSSIT